MDAENKSPLRLFAWPLTKPKTEDDMIYVTFQHVPTNGPKRRYAVKCYDVNQADIVAESIIHKNEFRIVRQSKPSVNMCRRIVITTEEFKELFGTI